MGVLKIPYIIFFAAICSALDAAGQIVALQVPAADEVVIGNPLVSRDAGNIIVEYDLLLGELISLCDVELQVSTDAGKTFRQISEGLTGDRNGLSSSGHKTIRIPLSRYAGQFAGKSMAFNLVVESIIMASENLFVKGVANCYIVSEEGSYKFPTVKGNSSDSVGDVKSVEVLWESFGTSTAPEVGDLIKSVSYSDGYITFQTADTFKEGNAVIAARNASGTILWSWHIWLTDEPGKCVYANNAGTMMDRNLGATSATPGDVGALGLLYQWGRKDPFLGSSSISDDVEAKSTISWPSAVSSSSSRGTISYATEHPTTFITQNSNNYDWYSSGTSSTDNTRWQSTKTIYDPCPAGWRVPDGGSNGVWNKAGFDDQHYDSSDKGMLFGSGISSPATWYPAAGYRGRLGGALFKVGYYFYCWSVAPSGYTAYSLSLDYDGYFNPASSNYRAGGQSVRCLQE